MKRAKTYNEFAITGSFEIPSPGESQREKERRIPTVSALMTPFLRPLKSLKTSSTERLCTAPPPSMADFFKLLLLVPETK